MTESISDTSWISKNLARLRNVVLAVGVLVFSALVIALVLSFLATMFFDDAFYRPVCFHRDCINEALRIFQIPIVLLKHIGTFAVGFTTVASLIVALGVYVDNSRLVKQHADSAEVQANSLQEQAKSSALQLHAVRFSSFRAYVSDAVGRFSRLSMPSIDVTAWYFKIYPNTYDGDISVNSYYIQAVKKIAAAMLAADDGLGPATRKFNYRDHQRTMIPLFADIGIDLDSLPRLDYFLIEDEVVELISSVHRVFGIESIGFGGRKYRGLN